MEDVRDCFRALSIRCPFNGAAILCLDDPNVQAVIPYENVQNSLMA